MDEIFKNNQYRILELFIEFSTKDFSIRGIARNLKLSHATVLKYINDLEKLEFIKKKEETLYPTYFANTQNKNYKFHKKEYLVSKLFDSGIIEFIQKEILPSSIILFGSVAKATFTEDSDIDIFVEAKETRLNFAKFEKKLKRKVNILFEPNINGLSKELRNNIINGIILYGYIKVK
mgnify:CR=1 FL=1|jgi:predicted nucleotidyltransferase